MIGILVVSHGSLAAGLLDAAALFFGKQPQLSALMLRDGDDAQDFRCRMEKAVAELDCGDGVLILADLFGGTPCNCAMALQSASVQVVAGVNLPMLMEALSLRDAAPISTQEIAAAARDGVVIPALADAGEDEDF